MSDVTIDWGRSWESANEEANKLRAERDALAAQLKEARTLLDRLGFELSEWSKGLYTYRCVACDEGDETTLRKEDIKHLPNCALDAFLNKTKEPTT